MLSLRIAGKERLVDIGAHQHTVVGGNAEEGDEAHPHGHAQVDGTHAEERPHVDVADGEVHEPRLAVEPHQNEAAGEGHEDTREVDERCRDRAELEIEDKQDNHQRHGDDNLQPLGGMLLLLVGAGEGVADALRQHYLSAFHLFVEHPLHLIHHFDLGQSPRLVKGDIADEERVLAVDHRSTTGELDVGHLTERYLGAVHSRYEYLAEHIGVVAQFTGIAYTDGETFAALHGVALAHAADGRRQDALHVAHLYAVARQLVTVEPDFHVWGTRCTVVVDRCTVDFRNLAHDLLELQACLLDAF